jgi:hypothetical protein
MALMLGLPGDMLEARATGAFFYLFAEGSSILLLDSW